MMQRMLNAVRAQAEMVGGSRAKVRMGLVSSYDPGSYCAKVRIQPEDTETGWLPIASPWVGNGWGLFCPPTIGDLVDVNYQEDDFEAGYVSLRFYNDIDRPLPVSGGELWLVHKSGSLLKFHNDGSVEVASSGNLTATVGGNLTANVTGSAVIKAASIALQNAGSALKALLNSAFATWATNHVHSNGNGGGNTGVPTTTPGSNTQTSIVQAE